MNGKPFVSAIIVAAGNSTRMSCTISKQLIPLLGKPAISYTLAAFQEAVSIDEVVVVCRNAEMTELKEIVKAGGFTKVKAFTVGGSDRSESVKNGVLAAHPAATHFAVHDGARPLITPRDINSVVAQAIICKAATLASQVTDTVKVVDENGVIAYTPQRSTLMAVQTPQVFERGVYLKALENAKGKGYTDDCAMVEEISVFPVTVLGSSANIKLTTVTDIPLAETILKKRQEDGV